MDSPDPHGPLVVTPIAVPAPITPTDDLAAILLAALALADVRLRDGDVVAVASKVVAITEGNLLPEAPGPDAAPSPDDDPRRAVARSLASRIVADAPQALVVATHHGFVCANAGIDSSNVAAGMVLLPEDPDASAAALRTALARDPGVDVAVVVTDTFGRPWRMGQVDVALGVAGMTPLRDERGSTDLHGRRLDVTVAALADEVAGAADLVRTKASRVPFVHLRGLDAGGPGTGADLVRPLDQDLFPVGGPTMFDHAVTHDPHGRTAPEPAATEDMGRVLDHAARLVARRDVSLAVVMQPRPAVEVAAGSPIAAGMAAEALRIVLAGRGIPVDVVEVDPPPGDDTAVRVAVAPSRHRPR